MEILSVSCGKLNVIINMEFAETLSQLSSQLLSYQKKERDLFLVEDQRQEDGVMSAPGRFGDVLYDQYIADSSYVRRRLKILRHFIRKLVNSGRLEKRDYRYLQEKELLVRL